MYSKIKSEHVFTNPFAIATVVDNKDPLYAYRVKIRLANLHDSVEDEDLPWAAKVDSSFMGVGNTDTLHSVPEVGSKVLVLFIGNDPNSIIYLGSLYKKGTSTPQNKDYLDTYGIYTKQGDFIGIDKIQKWFHMLWSGKVTLDIDGKVVANISSDLELNVDGKVKIGSNAIQPAPLGDDLYALIDKMILEFNTHTHTGNLGAPTTTPTSTIEGIEFRSNKVTIE